MGESDVHRTLGKIAHILDAEGIPYALVGALALNAYGYQRTTVDVDLLLTTEGLAKLKARCVGQGYLEKFAGSRGLRDAETGVVIDVVISGEYPGDGKPKPVAFPDPAQASVWSDAVRLLPLPMLLELKIASGMTAPHRLRDLADVIELVRATGAPRTLDDQLHPFVREKYRELWDAAQLADRE